MYWLCRGSEGKLSLGSSAVMYNYLSMGSCTREEELHKVNEFMNWPELGSGERLNMGCSELPSYFHDKDF